MMKEFGIVFSVIGAIGCAIILGIVLSDDCQCNSVHSQHTTHKNNKHKHKQVKEDTDDVQEQQQYHGPHLSVLPIGPKLFGPFHLGF